MLFTGNLFLFPPYPSTDGAAEHNIWEVMAQQKKIGDAKTEGGEDLQPFRRRQSGWSSYQNSRDVDPSLLYESPEAFVLTG